MRTRLSPPNARSPRRRLLDTSLIRGPSALRSRSIVVAGAGIGGLTASLALAAKGFRVVVLEQASLLEEAGAGIQLSPNALHVLHRLGLTERLAPFAVAPQDIRIMGGRSGREIVRVPLGDDAQARYGAPYWVIHRADLHGALLAAVRGNPDIELRLGARVQDLAIHLNGVTVQVDMAGSIGDEHGIALVGADGLWSTVRARLGDRRPPRFAQRTAWRATVPAERVADEFRAPATWLWLGPDAHLVHYPVTAGIAVNVVAIVRDDWQGPDWNAAGARDELLKRYARWHPAARTLLAIPDHWLKWALHDRPPDRHWGTGAVTLLGDAAHPMLPFLAQGAAMAIEDAHVLAACLAAAPEEPEAALRRYESRRAPRTARAQRAAARNSRLYHLQGPAALARNLALRAMGGQKLRARYDWIYDWAP
jgi:salicylate hydroxylase